jgi:hypothetical protein
MEYGGKSQGFGDDATIRTEADTLMISDSEIRLSGSNGIAIRSSANLITLERVSLTDNAFNGVYTYQSGSYSISMDDCQISSSKHYGLNIQHDVGFSISNSTFGSNTSGFMVLYPNLAGGIDPTNHFTSPGKIELISGNITRDAFWPGFFSNDSAWYFINNSLTVFGTADNPATLEIGQGAEIRFTPGAGSDLNIGYSASKGELIVSGTAQNPVKFTSAAASPAAGDWRYINLTSMAVNSSFHNTIFEYGGKSQGYDSDALLILSSSSPDIINCQFNYSGFNGICIAGNSAPYTFNNAFSNNNNHGVYCKSLSSEPDMSYNNFISSAGSGCLNDNNTHQLNASYSYWGSEDGPSGIGPGTGDEATGNVNITPWLTQPVSAGIEFESNIDSVKYLESQATLYLTTGLRWNVSENYDWLLIEPDRGIKSDSLVVLFSENPSADPREAILLFNSGDTLTKEISLIQPGAPPVISYSTPPQFSRDEGSYTLNIETNYSWTVESSCNWVTITPNYGLNNGFILIDYTANEGPDSRSCTITINGGGLSEDILLTQDFNTGIQDPENISPLIYPNPVRELLTIDNAEMVSQIRIMDVSGRSLLVTEYRNSNRIEMNLGEFETGIYFIILKLNNGKILTSQIEKL